VWAALAYHRAMSLRGRIETMPVGDLLDWLNRRLATGNLTLTRGPVVRRFHIDGGTITLASSSEQRVLLGRLLVDRGLLAPVELERALRAGRETGTRLGRVLTLVGLVPEADIQGLLCEKVHAMLADALGWTDGRFVFDDGVPPQHGRPMVRISIKLCDALRGARSAPALLALDPATRN
jgi:hypothetical protein